jgi:hypothetical protein
LPDALDGALARGAHWGSNRGSNVLSYPMYKDYRDKNQVFSGVLCLRGTVVNMSYDGPAERIEAELVSGGHGTRLRKTLVVVQVTLSLLLLVGSGLFVQSLLKLRTVASGFRPTNLIRFKLDPMLSGYGADRTRDFYAQLHQRLQGLPGVETAGLALVPIMEGYHVGFVGGPQVKLDMEIIGVVADTKYEDLRQEVPRQVLVAYPQMDSAYAMTVYIRTALPSEKMFAAVRAEMRNLDPSIPIFDMNTREDQLDRSLVLERLVAYLSSAFGLLATVLAGIGIGLALPLVWWLTRLVRSLLYGVEPRDPLTLALSAAGLLVVAVVAGALPALKASRLDPVKVLRYE